MTMPETHQPILGEPGATCKGCGTVLAEDQRYCLACGERRGEARLNFLELLPDRQARTQAPQTTAAGGPAVQPGVLDRLQANTAAIAGVACLILAIGVGVLIGKGGDDGASRQAAPQVISVGGAAAAPAATTDTPADAGGSGKSAAKAKSAAADDAGSTDSKATNPALKALDASGGSDYAKKAAKLPKTVGTGGAPPPKDNKPAAGGGDFEEIK